MTSEKMLASKCVLFVQKSANRDGSAVSGLMTVKALVDVGASVQVCFGHDGEVIRDYKSLGCKSLVLRHGDWLRAGGMARSTRRLGREWTTGCKLAKLMSGSIPDLIYVNSLSSLSGAVAAKKMAIPCVWHLREMFANVGGEMHPPALGGRWLVKMLLKNLSDKIVINSGAVRDNVLGPEFCDGKKLVVIPNAIPEGESQRVSVSSDFREELGIHPSTHLLAVIGSARPVKGHLFFLEVLSKLLMSGRKFSAVFAGDFSNPYGDFLASKVGELGLDRHVHMVGTLADVRPVYEGCNVVCIPSRSESFGRVAIEAFLNKVPVVATAVGGLREVVRHEENGALVEYGDVAGMAESIERLVSNEALKKSCIERAFLESSSTYSACGYQTRVRDVVLSVLGMKEE